jgi:hypothetical protein
LEAEVKESRMPTFIEFLQHQGDSWIKHGPASKEAIERYETAAGITLLSDHRAFLLWSNGGTLRGPKERFELLDVESMLDYVHHEDLLQYLPGMIVFGITDGGGIYFFDKANRFRRGAWAIYWGQMGDLNSAESRFAGKDLLEVANRIVAGVDFFLEPKIG